jgi:transcriptional regulator with XRE-family HTH domain
MKKMSTSPDYTQFLLNLRQARVAAGLNQVAVARRLKISQSYVSRCESGSRIVTVIDLLKFAKLYSVSIHDLLQLS